MFFFFFFNSDDDVRTIGKAFEMICLEKMKYDGYIEMSSYIDRTISNEEMLFRLAAIKSRFINLYKTEYPTKDTIRQTWEKMGFSLDKEEKINRVEAEAILYWAYGVLKETQQRIDETLRLFREIKELSYIDYNIVYKDGIFYNERKIEIKPIISIASFNSAISHCKRSSQMTFYRGHADVNYLLQPSIYRNSSWKNKESEMYQEVLITCPDDFYNLRSHLEKLVEMQHYGLPTRLLDITTNPLVALYFACENHFDRDGEVVLIESEKNEIRYPQSDTATILASLPVFNEKIQNMFKCTAEDGGLSQKDFNDKIGKLLHEIRFEKPAFEANIKKEDVLRSIIVLATKNNKRIIKQDGAFILCGLSTDSNELNRFRYQKKGKKLILLIKSKHKKSLLKDLSTLSINRSTLFPEIDNVTQHIKESYR